MQTGGEVSDEFAHGRPFFLLTNIVLMQDASL